MANEQNKKLVLAAVMTVIVISLLWMVFKKDSDNDLTSNISAQNTQPSNYSQTIGDSLAEDEPTKVVSAIQKDQFESASDQQKQHVQGQFDLATQHLLKKDWAKAESLLTDIIKRHPSLVEPYINLAFLYARNNKLNDARETLVRGIGANSTYELLFSNLQSIHGALAAEAYRSALVSDDFPEEQLSVANLEMNLTLVSSLELSRIDADRQQALLAEVKELQSKQALVQSNDSGLISQIADLESKLETANNRNIQQQTKFTAQIEKLEEQLTNRALATTQQTAQQQTIIANENQLTLNSVGTGTNEAKESVTLEKDEITEAEKAIGIQLVEEWAARWSDQDVQGYIQRYVANYRPSNNQISHNEWRDQRRERLTNKRFIDIDVDDFEFEENDNQFSVIFSQRYQSNTMDDTIVKKLIFSKNNNSWQDAKIIDEVILKS